MDEEERKVGVGLCGVLFKGERRRRREGGGEESICVVVVCRYVWKGKMKSRRKGGSVWCSPVGSSTSAVARTIESHPPTQRIVLRCLWFFSVCAHASLCSFVSAGDTYRGGQLLFTVLRVLKHATVTEPVSIDVRVVSTCTVCPSCLCFQ